MKERERERERERWGGGRRAKRGTPSHALTPHTPTPPHPPTELADLRAKFEEDKRRIAELRASRRFRPG